MVISYLAAIPERASLCATVAPTVPRRKADGSFERFESRSSLFFMGRLSDKRLDVCRDYYERKGARPPYLDLVECNDDPESILEFTLKLGPLCKIYPPSGEWRAHIGQPACPWKGDDRDFFLDVEGWKNLKQRFDRLVSLAENSTARSREISEFFRDEGWHAFDAGAIGLALDHRKDRWQPQLAADSLYLAFVSMVWLDISVRGRMLRRCENPRCREYFIGDKRNKIYCDNVCAMRVARRRWWRESGAKRGMKPC